MKTLKARQCGVIFLALMLVLFVSGSTLMLGALNNRQTTELAEQTELHRQMAQAKDALLAYAANSADLNNNSFGPGFFPCPDTDNDGLPQSTCNSDVPLVGRLPEYLTISGSRYYFNDYYAGVGRQLWYVVAPRYVYYSTGDTRRRASRRTSITDTINATPYRLHLDGDTSTEYVAFIIAPGDELTTQNRASGPNSYSNYLDGQNGASIFNYYTSYSSNPTLFNDEIIGITQDEYMVYVGSAVAKAMKIELDNYLNNDEDLDGNADYPPDYPSVSADFRFAFDDTHDWLDYDMAAGSYERWSRDTTWDRSSNVKIGTISFSGCALITFTINYTSGITRNGNSCD